MACYDAKERQKAAYSADMVWLIARGLSNGKLDVQAPSQFVRALDGVAQAHEDTRTGRQIIDDLRAKLRTL